MKERINEAMKPAYLQNVGMLVNSFYMKIIHALLTGSLILLLLFNKHTISPEFAALCLTYMYSLPELINWMFIAFSYFENEMTAFQR